MSSSFTITQPFLGAPLQFQPALGSQELESLIDNFVSGSADKQTKFSQVTTDFFLNATVDINTGALVRVYNVWMPVNDLAFESFEQSPTTSQTSSFSPTVYTPASSNGSFSMTPKSSVSSSHRVSKKTKETKKTAEIRLPGFQIMTRDGVDVTSSAGRGTKTKEQREHAHLMRIMKACNACKKKKIRCDPSHRRASTEMARSSTSPASQKPSPTSSVPSITAETSLPSFSPTNPIDDFVLYPEGSSPLSFDNTDLSQFNFDLSSALDDTSSTLNFQDYSHFDNHQFFNGTFDSQFGGKFNDQLYDGHLDNQLTAAPAMSDGYGLEVWDDSLAQSSSSDSWFANTTEDVVDLAVVAGYLSQWVENFTPLVVLARLLLMATMTAQLPRLLDVALRSWCLLTLVVPSLVCLLFNIENKNSTLPHTKNNSSSPSQKSRRFPGYFPNVHIRDGVAGGRSILDRFLNLMTEIA